MPGLLEANNVEMRSVITNADGPSAPEKPPNLSDVYRQTMHFFFSLSLLKNNKILIQMRLDFG